MKKLLMITALFILVLINGCSPITPIELAKGELTLIDNESLVIDGKSFIYNTTNDRDLIIMHGDNIDNSRLYKLEHEPVEIGKEYILYKYHRSGFPVQYAIKEVE